MSEYRRPGKALDRIRDQRVIRRFVKKLLVVGPGSVPGCWLWTGHVNAQGYGTFRYGNTVLMAHRISYAIWRGPVPGDMEVHHTHTPEGHDAPLTHCVNPKHLELVAPGENRAESNTRNGYRGKVKRTMLERTEAGEVETFECPRCRGTMVKGRGRYVCLNCDNVLKPHEVHEIEGGVLDPQIMDEEDTGDIPY